MTRYIAPFVLLLDRDRQPGGQVFRIAARGAWPDLLVARSREAIHGTPGGLEEFDHRRRCHLPQSPPRWADIGWDTQDRLREIEPACLAFLHGLDGNMPLALAVSRLRRHATALLCHGFECAP